MFIVIFMLGLLIGSFLNVCIYRIPREESINYPPSHCTGCDSKIKFYDLIPVISYIFLRGRCRHCKSKISIKYPIIELITSVLFISVVYSYGLTIISLKFLIMISFLMVISLIDFETQDVYGVTTYPCIIIGVIFVLVEKFYFSENVMNYFWGLIVPVVIIGLIVVATRGMGEGDIEIAAICGIYLGLQGALTTLFFAFIIGGIYGVVLIVLKSKKRKDEIAFGPFLFLGALISMFYGNQILELYLNNALMF
ncbi:MAG: A24 family peptidase [Clostridiaceae bacterium]